MYTMTNNGINKNNNNNNKKESGLYKPPEWTTKLGNYEE
jgi:hypothetical protein